MGIANRLPGCPRCLGCQAGRHKALSWKHDSRVVVSCAGGLLICSCAAGSGAASHPGRRHRPDQSGRVRRWIRSTTRRSMSSNSAARSAPCATTRVSPALLPRHSIGDLGRRRARAARPRLPARSRRRRAASTSTSPTPTATPWSRATRARRRARSIPNSRFDLMWPDGRRVHRAAVLESQRRPSRVRARRLSLHRAWATAAAAAIR